MDVRERLGMVMEMGEMAVREGFEPSLGFPLNTLSKRAPSTTRPPHPARTPVGAGLRKARNIRIEGSRTSAGLIVGILLTIGATFAI